ncbi:hypothetical protein FB639_006488, partial [Coemansia asiatica]
DMCQQLRLITKPRNFYELKPYQGMVQFGLQNKGAYFSYNGNGNDNIGIDDDVLRMFNGRRHSGLGRRRSSSLSGFDDSDDDGEARDEEVPRFYFRKQISHITFSDSENDESDAHSTYFKPVVSLRADKGVGNIALLCNIPEDRSANFELAKQFELMGQSTEWVCRHNASVASLNGRNGLAHIWTMLACLLGPVSVSGSNGSGRDGSSSSSSSSRVGGMIWSTHPPLVRWLRSVMVHYEKRGDVQTLALLSCVLCRATTEASAMTGDELGDIKTVGAQSHPEDNSVADNVPSSINGAESGGRGRGRGTVVDGPVANADMPPWMTAAAAAVSAGA